MSFGPRESHTGDAVRLIAHRGFAEVYPENTLAAMRGAVADGVDVIEIDVQPCADGTVVVFHNASLDETTDRSGVVADLPSDVVCEAIVLESEQTVPTFAAVMDAVPPAVAVNVELKHPGSHPASDDRDSNSEAGRWTPLVDSVLEVLADHENPILFSSFHPAALGALRALDSTAALAFLFEDSRSEPFGVAEQYDCVALHPALRATDADLIARAHETGLAVNPYTVRTTEEADRLLELGVDGLVADSAAVLDRS